MRRQRSMNWQNMQTSTSGPAADVNGTQYNRAGPGGQWCTWYTVHNREGLQTMYHDAPNDLIIIVKWSIYIVYILVLVLSSWIIGGYSAVFNLLLAQQGLLSTQICWKSSNLNNFDIKWSQDLHSCTHTWYLSFFLHRQIFCRIKFTPKTPICRVKSVKNANFSR